MTTPTQSELDDMNQITKSHSAIGPIWCSRKRMLALLDHIAQLTTDNAGLLARVTELEAALANEREECAKIVEASLLVKEDSSGTRHVISPTNEQRAAAIRTGSYSATRTTYPRATTERDRV